MKFEGATDRCTWLKKEDDKTCLMSCECLMTYVRFYTTLLSVFCSVWDLLTCCPPPRIQRLSVNNLQKVVDFSECLELFFTLSLCPHLIRDHCEVHFCLGVPLTLAAVGVNILALHVLCSSPSDDLCLGSLPLPSSTYFQPLMLGLATVSGVVSPTLSIEVW